MTAENPEPAADRAQSYAQAAAFCEHEWVAGTFTFENNGGALPFGTHEDRLVLETILCVDCGETKAVDLEHGDRA